MLEMEYSGLFGQYDILKYPFNFPKHSSKAHLIFGEEYIDGGIILHAHLEVEAAVNT